MKPYEALYPSGTAVHIVDGETLRQFLQTWNYHNPLKTEQLPYADKIAKVAKVGFYHGGDALYELEGVPGIWHEACLRMPMPE